ncbi:MAG TPA: hypothetical protein ENI41_01750 [Deltaproteobacteria bacterium]|nr:hypothetical protein [Deltaproteobacteria bacterium]
METKWQKKLNGDPIPWLLESNPWTKYEVLTELLNKPDSSSEVIAAKQELINHPQIQDLIKETKDWLPKAPTRNNDSTISYYKLRMLTDFGLTISDSGMKEIFDMATAHKINNLFASRGTEPIKPQKNKPDPYADEWHIAPCNSPIILYSLLCLDPDNSQVKEAVEELKNRWNTNQGWFCHYFFVESMFKKLQVGCQMAGLMALEVFSKVPELKESINAQNAYYPLKFHYEYGKTMYYFGRSKRFWTLKYPFVWYNALYLAEVLTRFEFVKTEKLVQELVTWIEQAQDNEGRFTPTSMFMAYKGWDFANKKEPSPWITFLCCRILKRWYNKY